MCYSSSPVCTDRLVSINRHVATLVILILSSTTTAISEALGSAHITDTLQLVPGVAVV